MPGNKDNLKYLYEAIEGYVTFGDGQQAQVKGKWTLNVEGIPNLKEVLYVEGLRVNLVSVSQLCDSELIWLNWHAYIYANKDTIVNI